MLVTIAIRIPFQRPQLLNNLLWVEFVHYSDFVLQAPANLKYVPMELSKESLESLSVMFVHLAILVKQVFRKNVQPTKFVLQLMQLYTLTHKHAPVAFIYPVIHLEFKTHRNALHVLRLNSALQVEL